MIKIAKIALGIGAFISINTSHAQLANKPGVTTMELHKRLNELFYKGQPGEKELAFELKAAAESTNEDFVNLAIRTYTGLKEEENKNQYEDSLLKRFPKGIKARQIAYDESLAKSEAKSAITLEEAYKIWVTNFPSSNFNNDNQLIYPLAVSKIAVAYLKENNIPKAEEYIKQCKALHQGYYHTSTIARKLLEMNRMDLALPLLEDTYLKALKGFNPSDVPGARYAVLPRVIILYSENLLQAGSNDKALAIMKNYFEIFPVVKAGAEEVMLLAKAYAKNSKLNEAFAVLDEFLVSQQKNTAVIKMSEEMFKELYGESKSFTSYQQDLKQRSLAYMKKHFKEKMINQTAPKFTLLNQKGEAVSLDDFKGKVLVMDFWATWCGPCKASFPGMQAAVNKYKEDKEVAFLFIDVFEKQENYKEQVAQLMKSNNYSFEVVFDEMKDRENSTAKAYQVSGIPTKIIIDKKGVIRFQTVGGGSDVERIVDEISTKIELTKEG